MAAISLFGDTITDLTSVMFSLMMLASFTFFIFIVGPAPEKVDIA